MQVRSSPPSTLDGISRRAKKYSRTQGIPHVEALDLVSREAGYQNHTHARHVLESAAPMQTQGHGVYLSAYWWLRGHPSGRITTYLPLEKPLLEILTPSQIAYIRKLGDFKVDAIDHLEVRVDRESRSAAEERLLDAARVLRFVQATDLVPATTVKSRRPMAIFEKLPGRDHERCWIHRHTGEWVYMDEPYPKSSLAERADWVAQHGLYMIKPEWEGLHNPGYPLPHLFTSNKQLADLLERSILALPPQFFTAELKFDIAAYDEPFISPARQISGKRKPERPMPSFRGYPYRGVITYGAYRVGEQSLRRPAKVVPHQKHMAIGAELLGLLYSKLSKRHYVILDSCRSQLDGWMEREHPDLDLPNNEFYAPYYGQQVEQFGDVVAQLAAIERVINLLEESYNDCGPRRQLVKRIRAVGESLRSKHCAST